ncbi:MAG: glycosyltransferase family 4 protein [Haloarculaceae archaeon]
MHVLNLVTSRESTCFQQQVRTLEEMGVECTNLSISETREHTDESIERRSVAEYPAFYARAIRESFGDYDLVHANYGLTAPAAVLQPRLPAVVSLWGSDLMGRVGPLSKVCARLADEVIVMSAEMAAEVPGDARVIPHGVDADMFAPASRAEARAELGWDRDARYVLFPYAASREVKNYPRAERVVERAGDRLDDDVRLQTAAGIDHDRMSIHMNAADVVLMTSEREGSPNTIKEALVCNVPVVSTDVGDVSGQLAGVSPAAVGRTDDELVDGLVSVLRANGRSNGRRKVERELSAERMGERILGVYEELVDEPRPAAERPAAPEPSP